jgi:hypothetical protein
MGYRSRVAYAVMFVSEQDKEPERAFVEFTRYVHWLKNTHTVITEDASTPTQGVTKIYTYEDEICGWSGSGDSKDGLSIYPQSLMIIFEADWVKWYESFPDVRWHEEALRALEDDSYKTANYKFIRIGEETEDIDIKLYDPTAIGIHDSIELIRDVSVSHPREPQDCPKPQKEAV